MHRLYRLGRAARMLVIADFKTCIRETQHGMCLPAIKYRTTESLTLGFAVSRTSLSARSNCRSTQPTASEHP